MKRVPDPKSKLQVNAADFRQSKQVQVLNSIKARHDRSFGEVSSFAENKKRHEEMDYRVVSHQRGSHDLIQQRNRNSNAEEFKADSALKERHDQSDDIDDHALHSDEQDVPADPQHNGGSLRGFPTKVVRKPSV